MRIVQLSTMREYYGGEVCLTNLARGLAGRGHDVTCIVRHDGRLAGELSRLGLPTLEMPLVDWFEPVSTARLGAWLRRERVDIVHTHTPRDWFIAAAATFGGPVRNVATRHLLRPVAHAELKRAFLRRLDVMIAVSDAVRRGVQAGRLVAPDRLVTVPNGIALPGPGSAPGSLRAWAELPADTPVIGCVARLTPEKGLVNLLRAAALLRPRWPGLAVLILGDAPEGAAHPRELLELSATLDLDRTVRFCGYVPGAAARCAEFDIQVVCSLAEPCGLATLEAMAQGRPVVATASGGSPELIDDGREGFLVPPDDSERLARRLDCLLDSPGLRCEMGRRGRERVIREFSLEHMIERTENVYRNVLERAAG